jgi:hypothetical protein
MPAMLASTRIRKVESLPKNQIAVVCPDMCPVRFSDGKKDDQVL